MLTTEQAAAQLKVTRRRIVAMIEAGALPAKRFGHAWMIEPAALKLVKVRKPGRPRKEK